MSFCPIGESQKTAWRVVMYLRRRYSEWTADRTAGDPYPIPYLRWTDLNDRDAMYLICDLHPGMPKEG